MFSALVRCLSRVWNWSHAICAVRDTVLCNSIWNHFIKLFAIYVRRGKWPGWSCGPVLSVLIRSRPSSTQPSVNCRTTQADVLATLILTENAQNYFKTGNVKAVVKCLLLETQVLAAAWCFKSMMLRTIYTLSYHEFQWKQDCVFLKYVVSISEVAFAAAAYW